MIASSLDSYSRFFRLISDEEAITWIVSEAAKLRRDAENFVYGLRHEAVSLGFAQDDRIHARVLPGCKFKDGSVGAYRMERETFQQVNEWDFPDPPTVRSLVSWVFPSPFSTGKTAALQLAALTTMQELNCMPEWYPPMTFGNVTYVAGLALEHLKATNKDPFNGLFVRTDTCCRINKRRLVLRFVNNRLECSSRFDETSVLNLAVMPVGVLQAEAKD